MSVIRRKHTKNFTTIGNELFNDERLAADEVGILAYLLSQPPDWEIRRPQLRKRWKVGGDRMKRIIDNWLRTGWLHAEKTRLSNGTFTIIYEVRDQPGPTLSDDDIRAALSAVSAGVGNDDTEDDDGLDSTGPPPGEPPLDGRLADTRGWEESLNTDSINTNPTKAVAWSEVRNGWPASEILSPVACEKLFAALSQKDRQQAFEGIKPYLSRCKERNRKICDLSTYLKERRFETAQISTNGILSACKPSTPEAARWIEYYEAIGVNKLSPGQRFALRQLKHGQTTTVPSQWPPPLPAKQSTGPPLPFSDLMKPGEEDDLKWG